MADRSTCAAPRGSWSHRWRTAERTRLLALAASAVLVAITAFLGNLSSGRHPAQTPPPGSLASAPVTADVLYEVTGTTRSAFMTMNLPMGTAEFAIRVPMVGVVMKTPGLHIPFEHGSSAYLTAQSKQGQGTVTCRISVDGVVIAENTATGPYTLATCRGTV